MAEFLEFLELEESPLYIKNPISRNISDQGRSPSCWDHSATRVILRVIKMIIPEFFPKTNGTNKDCNELYNQDFFYDIYKKSEKCDNPKELNNLIMYIYIFICIDIGNITGKVDQFSSDAFKYIISLINNGNIMNECAISSIFMIMYTKLEKIMDTTKQKINEMMDITKKKKDSLINLAKKKHEEYMTKIQSYIDITQEICTALVEKLQSTNKQMLHFNKMISNETTGPEYIRSMEFIKHIIDSGYYMTISSILYIDDMPTNDDDSDHSMVVINYENSGDDIILFIKNSYGYSDEIFDMMDIPMDKGIIKIPLKKAIEFEFVDFEYLLVLDIGQDIGEHAFTEYVKNGDIIPRKAKAKKAKAKKTKAKKTKTKRVKSKRVKLVKRVKSKKG
jgi:hypothetical protein